MENKIIENKVLKSKTTRNNAGYVILSLVAMMLWGSLFPSVKIGYKAFDIDTAYVPNILMFAALRFTICGVIVCVLSAIKKEKLEEPKSKSILNITIMGIFGIVLHYAFTYVGLSMTESSKTALLKQLGVLFYVCFAFIFFKNERFSVQKIAGAVIGFGGIAAINAGEKISSVSVGDTLIILASLCTVVSSVISKKAVEGSSPFWATGISQLTGGFILFIAALAAGGNFPSFNLKATFVFIYICSASIIGYTLWYYVMRKMDLSRLFIIKFSEPLFACLFGAILLNEDIFKLQYLAAFLLISAGIVIGNQRRDESVSNTNEIEGSASNSK